MCTHILQETVVSLQIVCSSYTVHVLYIHNFNARDILFTDTYKQPLIVYTGLLNYTFYIEFIICSTNHLFNLLHLLVC